MRWGIKNITIIVLAAIGVFLVFFFLAVPVLMVVFALLWGMGNDQFIMAYPETTMHLHFTGTRTDNTTLVLKNIGGFKGDAQNILVYLNSTNPVGSIGLANGSTLPIQVPVCPSKVTVVVDYSKHSKYPKRCTTVLEENAFINDITRITIGRKNDTLLVKNNGGPGIQCFKKITIHWENGGYTGNYSTWHIYEGNISGKTSLGLVPGSESTIRINPTRFSLSISAWMNYGEEKYLTPDIGNGYYIVTQNTLEDNSEVVFPLSESQSVPVVDLVDYSCY